MTVRRGTTRKSTVERAALLTLTTRATRAVDPETSLAELAGLAEAAGAEVVLRAMQERPTPDAATVFGKGKAEDIALACRTAEVDIVIIDHHLSPAQARNLECVFGRRVIDRTELILDIFALRARTREGKLQVELAQLQYMLPRLVGSSEALSRLGGGIGTRGPGETKLETDRRRIRHRIAALKREIAEVSGRRGYLRARRRRGDVPTVALVGYTNAGKTTLFNVLTGDNAVASDALFVTLDPLVRRVRLPDARHIMMADTVGFIDRLPHSLVAAFRATLEEVIDADLLLHVVDASAEDRERRDKAVRDVLAEIGAGQVPMLEVYNKCDRLDPRDRDRLAASSANAVCVSATQQQGIRELLDLVTSRLAMDTEAAVFELDYTNARDRQFLTEVHRHGQVTSQVSVGDHVTVQAGVPRRWLEKTGRMRPTT
ncbi:MAG: GTPase HflX [Acidimicrobiia bacterium]|nr:GTPase HflX [Acidimicrobiia bacterium]